MKVAWFSHTQRQSFAMVSAASMTAILLVALVTLLIFIMIRGTAFFWPQEIETIHFRGLDGETRQVFAKKQQANTTTGHTLQASSSQQVDTEYSLQASFITALGIQSETLIVSEQQLFGSNIDPNVVELHMDNGDHFFFLAQSLETPSQADISLAQLSAVRSQVEALEVQIERIRDGHLSPIHRQIAQFNRSGVAADAPAREKLEHQFFHFQNAINELQKSLYGFALKVADAEGREATVRLSEVAHVYFPNRLSTMGKIGLSLSRIAVFLIESPKQTNTTGGIFPALFGTILMVLLMTLIVTPFGVLAAIYLSEYAPANAFTSALRIGVSNMAGVPSIVYGVFGLGFFVYGIGGSIDSLFFAEHLPSPTFGSPGLFWASLTMALLTLPVVVVATEEGLKRVPQGIRNSSYALGATKIETIWYTVLPIASPGIMTGMILAIARAAGEVAPLMLVGAVKFAPSLPVDGEFPFLHLERQFMHLGVLIYDGAFHSQTSLQGTSMMFAACLLLLICVFGLNLIAINLRSRLRKRYSQE
ncbi:phosphate ABC transporter permease PstA [Alteromonas flava]|uniref:phosphate ABC transporter permease PstA n=1 Tax=Alteromonas flava TaxID=2048003 RepID=UPI000C294ADC|nr:phosphate ABC transporter permease PstA [Alteromonas flava]